MKKRRLSLTIVFPIVIGIIVSTAAAAFLISNIRTVNRAGRDQLISGNRAMLSVSTRLMFNALYESDVWTINNMLDEFTGEENIIHAAVRDIDGNIVAESTTEEWTSGKLIAQGLVFRALAQGTIIQHEIDDQFLLIGPISIGPEQLGTLELAFDMSKFQSSLIRSSIFTALITITFLGVAVFVSSLVFRRFILGPINALVLAADDIGHGNLDTKIPEINLEEPTVLTSALENMRSNLQNLYQDLETQVKNLERRAKYQEATALIARDAAASTDIDELISSAINLIGERFDFYRQGIFLLNPDDDWVVLHSASGADVEQLLEDDYKLRAGQEGIVGHVSATGEAYVAQNVEEDPIFVPDAGSKEICSELALPLQTRGEFIGVLSVQSQQLDAFREEDVAVLQTLADLIAVAISNARLLRQTQDNLEAISRAYGELSRETWTEMLRVQQNIGYYSDVDGVMPLIEIDQNLEGNSDLPLLEIPVSVRGHIIGTIQAHKYDGGGDWTEEETLLLNSMAEQLNLALESARLFEDTQRRAIQEQMTSEITARMRETLDIETVLETTAREIGTAMNLAAFEIQLGTPNEEETE